MSRFSNRCAQIKFSVVSQRRTLKISHRMLVLFGGGRCVRVSTIGCGGSGVDLPVAISASSGLQNACSHTGTTTRNSPDARCSSLMTRGISDGGGNNKTMSRENDQRKEYALHALARRSV